MKNQIKYLSKLAFCVPILFISCNLQLPNLSISNLSFKTNYYLDTDLSKFVICDNKVTYLTYGFRYSGSFGQFTSVFIGQKSGLQYGSETFSPDLAPDVFSKPNEASVTLILDPTLIPTALPNRLTAASIAIPTSQKVKITKEKGKTDIGLTFIDDLDNKGTTSIKNIIVGDCEIR